MSDEVFEKLLARQLSHVRVTIVAWGIQPRRLSIKMTRQALRRCDGRGYLPSPGATVAGMRDFVRSYPRTAGGSFTEVTK